MHVDADRRDLDEGDGVEAPLDQVARFGRVGVLPAQVDLGGRLGERGERGGSEEHARRDAVGRADVRHPALGVDRDHGGDAQAVDQRRDVLLAAARVSRAAAHLLEGALELRIHLVEAAVGRRADRSALRGGLGVAGELRSRVLPGRLQARGLARARVGRISVGQRGAQRVSAVVGEGLALRIGRRRRRTPGRLVVGVDELAVDLGDASRLGRSAHGRSLGRAAEEPRLLLADRLQLRAEAAIAPRARRDGRAQDDRACSHGHEGWETEHSEHRSRLAQPRETGRHTAEHSHTLAATG